MENARSSSKMKVPKVKTLSENVSPLQMEMEDQRGRYHQSMATSPRFQPYAENINACGGSPLARYFLAGSPISGTVSPAGEAFTSPTFGSSKYSRSAKACGSNSSGNNSVGFRRKFSLSPLSSIENLEIAPPSMYGTPVKVDEEVLVMDDILVRPTSVGKSGRSSSSSSSGRGSSSSSWSPPFVKSVFKTESGNYRHNSKCQFARGKEEHPTRLSMKPRSEAQTSKSSMSAGSSIHGPNSRTVHQHHAAAESENVVVTTSQPPSPVKPAPRHILANPNAVNDWSPLDDGIKVDLPNGSDKAPSREEVDAYISSILHGPTAKRRLPVFEKLCEGRDSDPHDDKRPPH